MVLAGGAGTRLDPLTRERAKPAVPFGGRYRIIDFCLSNFVNSGIYKVKVLTQYKSDSLNSHISRTWRMTAFLGHYCETVPAQMRTGGDWYKGSADAIFQNLNLITDEQPDTVFVFGADHIYQMNVQHMLDFHRARRADCTVAVLPVPIEQGDQFGILHVAEDGEVKDFIEKPKNPPPMPGKTDIALCSMGIYVFDTKFLIEELRRDAADPNSAHDFGKDIIPHLVKNGKAIAHHFSRSCVRSNEEAHIYWRDVGTVDAYWAANIDLTDIVPDLDLYDREWPIWTYGEITPPAKFVHDLEGRRGSAVASLVSGGCIVSGASIKRTMLSPNVRVNSFSSLEEAVVLPSVHIHRNVRLTKVVIDTSVVIPEGLVVGEDPDLDARRRTLITLLEIDGAGGGGERTARQ